MNIRTISEKELAGALQWIRNLRRWAVLNHVDPWAVRQALIMALESDTASALRSGVKPETLQEFDQGVKQDIKACIKTWLKDLNSKES